MQKWHTTFWQSLQTVKYCIDCILESDTPMQDSLDVYNFAQLKLGFVKFSASSTLVEMPVSVKMSTQFSICGDGYYNNILKVKGGRGNVFFAASNALS